MPLHLITGLPGNAKTLYTIDQVKKRAEEEKRTVYYHGIKELKLPWVEMENAHEWYDCPVGSIIVIDEAQFTFPPRQPGAKVPEAVSRFTTHRHDGHDVYIITQDPSLIDHAVRKLVAKHWHMKAVFGLKRSTVFEWQKIAQNPDDYHTKKEALTFQYNWNKKLYGLYKSAEQHTIQRKLPKMVIFKIVALLGVVVVCLTLLLSWMNETKEAKVPAEQQQTRRVVSEGTRYFGERWTLEETQARIKGLEYTAPMYDGVTQVRTFPKIAGCMHIEMNGQTHQCTCSSQQGTRLNVTVDQCRHYVASGGWFDFTQSPNDSNRGERSFGRGQQAEEITAGVPALSVF